MDRPPVSRPSFPAGNRYAAVDGYGGGYGHRLASSRGQPGAPYGVAAPAQVRPLASPHGLGPPSRPLVAGDFSGKGDGLLGPGPGPVLYRPGNASSRPFLPLNDYASDPSSGNSSSRPFLPLNNYASDPSSGNSSSGSFLHLNNYTGNSGTAASTPFPPVEHTGAFDGSGVVTIDLENSVQVFNTIKRKVQKRSGHLYIGLDLEYCASSATDLDHRPFCPNDWYEYLKKYVNEGALVQIGPALAFEGPVPSPVEAYQVNVHIDVQSGGYHPSAVDFLESQGHKLAEYRDRGVMPEWLFADVLSHLPFGDDSVTWITFHGDRDVGFLLRLLIAGGRGTLPSDKFLHVFRDKFPLFYDVKVLAQLVQPRFAGKLTKLTKLLGVQRQGEEHFAGSDALLTLGYFNKIVEISAKTNIVSRMGLLSGLEELELSMTCGKSVNDSGINVLKVTAHNYDEEAARISDLVGNNFQFVAMQVLLPASQDILGTSAGAQSSYERVKKVLDSVDRFDLLIAFMNAEGVLGHGRVWQFSFNLRLDGADQDAYVCPRRLACVLASSGVTHRPNTVWVTVHGAYGIACLLKAFLSPVDLPHAYRDFIISRAACFPCLYDIGLLANSARDLALLPTGCNGGLGHISSALGVLEDPCEVVTLLRTFNAFQARPDFQSFVPGGLMERCCPACLNMQ
ncbi:uncharacterized protein [Aegilops tauschii subsp. strangulata]|uniref:uncharacterized protein n=1 Tax=Aegilops tauschii subsp. strangulata TaxID=200361 RepID=UPI001ABC129D|nr:uncharacterized protein LOC109738864 [Aegilops tauschii subsp. strangulata]